MTIVHLLSFILRLANAGRALKVRRPIRANVHTMFRRFLEIKTQATSEDAEQRWATNGGDHGADLKRRLHKHCVAQHVE